MISSDSDDDNPPLDAEFFARAKPALLGRTLRLQQALSAIVEAHDAGKPLDRAIADAKDALGTGR